MAISDSLLKALDYVTTSRRAWRLVFVLTGISLAFKYAFPQLNSLIPIPIQEIQGIYFNVHFFISFLLGMCAGALSFNFAEWLLAKIKTFYAQRELDKENLQRLNLATQLAQQKQVEFKNSFKIAYPRLDHGSKLILHSLQRNHDSLYPRDNTVLYLKNQGWIEQKIPLPNGYYLYEINNNISQAINEIIEDEIDGNLKAFINSEKPGCKKIIEILLNSATKQESDYLPFPDYVSAWGEINNCFSIDTGETQITISFRLGYKEKLQNIVSSSLPDKITIDILK